VSEKNVKVLEIVCDVTELEDLTLDSSLDIEEWDSLAIVSFLSEVDNNFEQVLSPTDVNNAKVIADLAALIS
jgi:acyl carrier protein